MLRQKTQKRFKGLKLNYPWLVLISPSIYCVDPSWKVSWKRGVDTFFPKCQHQKIAGIAGFLKFKTFPYETLLAFNFYFPFVFFGKNACREKIGVKYFLCGKKMHISFLKVNLKRLFANKSTSKKRSFSTKIFCGELEETFCQQLNFQ